MSWASLSHRVAETPVAVVDIETTGLSPGGDRVVELSVVRIEPGEEPQLILDTLINPQRPVSATEIHGIRDSDVVDAPVFADVAGNFIRALHGCVVAAYNVYFDMGFIGYELSRIGIRVTPPHLCLMYLRPMLGLGCRCSLGDACRAHGVDHSQAHQAATDALASARLWPIYLRAAQRGGITTFGELARLKAYKFVDSWRNEPFWPPLGEEFSAATRLKSRSRMVSASTVLPLMARETLSVKREDLLHEYWDGLKSVLTDLRVTPEEQAYLERKKAELGLSAGEVRAVHARAFADLLRLFADDRAVDDEEDEALRKVHQCLRELGWAPGL